MGIIVALAVFAYLILLIDWKELLGALGQGGWASIVLYAFLTVLIVMVLTSPDIPHMAPMGGHH